MATVTEYWIVGLGRDSRNKSTDISFRISAADFASWTGGANAAARALTPAGVLINKVAGLSGIYLYERHVEMRDIADNVTHPPADDNIYNFDKLSVGVKAGIDHYTWTIPGRLDDAYNVADNGVDVIITGAGASTETLDAVDAIQTTALGKNGAAVVVEKIRVDR